MLFNKAVVIVVSALMLGPIVQCAEASGKAANNQPPPSRVTLLFMQAVMNENYEMMESFLGQGADINCGNCNNEKQTPLMYAAKQSVRTRESNKRLRYLVSNGADVNRQDRRGMTALAMAVGIGPNPYWSTVDDALYLLEHGANPSIRDDAGNTALHQLAQVAIVPNIGVDREFQQTVRNMIHTVGSALVQHGADVNAQNNTDETPLHIVASKCGAYSISLLLSANADPAKKNKLGQTPLRIAEEKAASSGSGSSCNEAVGLLRNPAAATNVANGQNGVEGTASGKDGLLELIGAVGGALQILNKRAP